MGPFGVGLGFGASGGGSCDYPSESTVLLGTIYDFGLMVGSLSQISPDITGLSTELYHGVDDIIAQMIWANRNLGTDPTYWETAMADSAGTHAWPVHPGGEPDRPDNCITVYETTPQFDAKLMVTGEVMEHRGFTVRIRGKGPTKNVARRKAEQIRADFNHGGCTDQDVTMADGTVYFIPCVSRTTLVPFGRDTASSQRWLVNLNCLAVILRRP